MVQQKIKLYLPWYTSYLLCTNTLCCSCNIILAACSVDQLAALLLSSISCPKVVWALDVSRCGMMSTWCGVPWSMEESRLYASRLTRSGLQTSFCITRKCYPALYYNYFMCILPHFRHVQFYALHCSILEKPHHFGHGIAAKKSPIVYVNTCSVIATSPEPWQRRASVEQPTPLGSDSFWGFGVNISAYCYAIG